LTPRGPGTLRRRRGGGKESRSTGGTCRPT